MPYFMMNHHNIHLIYIICMRAVISLIKWRFLKIAILKPPQFSCFFCSGWINTIQEELNQFEKSKVWTLVPLPKGHSIIDTR